MSTPSCPICLGAADKQKNYHECYYFECQRCGNFRITRAATSEMAPGSEILGDIGSRERANLSSWMRETQPTEQITEFFFKEDAHDFLGEAYRAVIPPDFFGKADKLLMKIEEDTKFPGEAIDLNRKPKKQVEYLARSWSLNENELKFILRYLRDNHYISGGVFDASSSDDPNGMMFDALVVEPRGWQRIKELRDVSAFSNQCFIAMPFESSLRPVYDEAIRPAIKNAGYEPYRVDDEEHINRIDDQIMAEIKRSRLLVADLTGNNANVSFEAGFALGLGIPVVWTAEEEDRKKLKLDYRQYNCLGWKKDDFEGFVKRLAYRIENACGPGKGKKTSKPA